MHSCIKRGLVLLGLLTCFSPVALAVNSDATCYGDDAVLMLHMDGADASTTFTDDSNSAHSPTASGQAQIDTAVKKLGAGSGLFDGANDDVTVSDSTDWDFSGDFTIDFWVYLNADENGAFFTQRVDADNYFILMYLQSTPAIFFEGRQSATTVFSRQNSWSPSTSTWYHIALTRSGSSWYTFVDGTQVGTTLTDSDTVTGLAADLLIGQAVASVHDLNGHLDEFRVVKGQAIWTGNFTAPSAAYTDCNATSFVPTMEII